ncbi:MAG: hypothetical protein L3J88_08500 [Gammaproteobacteria bacterium]|nr:hypothetical protein [Gammaproteobacteria bacterium]MCF6363368.1 hypothetical protein [Gammaproteobacteria bacterium]
MQHQTEVIITIAKLLEVAYSKNKGVTTKIMRKKGNFKLTVDGQGNAILSGGAGMLTFKANSALQDLGVEVRNVSIAFSKGDGNDVKYTAMFSFVGVAAISVSGKFNIEELILSCSGLLCLAARALKGKHIAYDMELQKIMGR